MAHESVVLGGTGEKGRMRARIARHASNETAPFIYELNSAVEHKMY